MKFEWWMFVVGAVLSWGIYVPVLHEGQAAMGDGKPSAGAMKKIAYPASPHSSPLRQLVAPPRTAMAALSSSAKPIAKLTFAAAVGPAAPT